MDPLLDMFDELICRQNTRHTNVLTDVVNGEEEAEV